MGLCIYQSDNPGTSRIATGDLDEDAKISKDSVSNGILEVAVTQSLFNDVGLYGERVGAFHFKLLNLT